MIILKVMDGLGNQMFQYAFARRLQEEYNEEIIFETSSLSGNSIRKFGLERFNIAENCRMAGNLKSKILRAFSKLCRDYLIKVKGFSGYGNQGFVQMSEKGFYATYDSIEFHPIVKCNKRNKFIAGYFQSEKYFKPIAEKIKKELTLKAEAPQKSKEMLKKIDSCNSVAVHIRRGDYVGNSKFDVCNESYYKEAMKKMSNSVEKPKFYIFSNTHSDFLWIQENYDFSEFDVVYVDEGNNEFEDFRLMSSCKHFVIPNSTYSWWAAYLSENEQKKVIAPARWFNSNENTEDIYPEGWERI